MILLVSIVDTLQYVIALSAILRGTDFYVIYDTLY